MANRRHFLFSSFACAAIVAVSGCGGLDTYYPDYRYRVTVEVDTPEGLKTGSSVILVKSKKRSEDNLTAPGNLVNLVRGEAVTVELGKRGILFMTLESKNRPNWPTDALFMTYGAYLEATKQKVPTKLQDEGEWIKRLLAFDGKHPLPRYFSNAITPRPKDGEPPNAYPLMVTFKDLKRPESVVLVDPDHLERSFGTGVRLRQITIETTDDSVTTGIAMRLPWLKTLKTSLVKRPLDVSINEMPVEQTLTPRDFTRGILDDGY